MKAQELFERMLAAWPSALDISDRQQTQSGYWFPAVASANQSVEETIDFSIDHWSSVAAWAFYQAIVSYAGNMYEAGHRSLSPSSVPLAMFDARVRSNLQSPGFEEEAAAYEPL
jgi:hypothetical protein